MHNEQFNPSITKIKKLMLNFVDKIDLQDLDQEKLSIYIIEIWDAIEKASIEDKNIQKTLNAILNKKSVTPKKSTKIVFNPLPILYDEGEFALRSKLQEMDDLELHGVMKFYKLEGYRRKNLDRNYMIEQVIRYATKELNRGKSFMRDTE